MRWAARTSARLPAPVPEPVNEISVRSAPNASAARSRARSSAVRAARPSVCGLDGLPSGRSPSAVLTSGRTGAEPASSRKMRRSAAAVVRLVDELCERALEVLEIHVKVEDLVDRDRLARNHPLRRLTRLLDRLDGSAPARH